MLKLFVMYTVTYWRSHYHKVMADRYVDLITKYAFSKHAVKHNKRIVRYNKRLTYHIKRFWDIQRTIDKLQKEWISKYE